jgi:S-formylglutathione hydrolase FrmB
MRKRLFVVVAVAVVLAALAGLAGGAGARRPAEPAAGLKEAKQGTLGFQIKVAKGAVSAPVTGRAFVIITEDGESEPRFQIDTTGVPFFGMDVSRVQPGRTMTMSRGANVYGYPLTSIRKIPAGVYYVQAFFNVYTKFERSDGSTVWLHMPGGDGQDPFSSPGNLYSKVIKVRIDPARAMTVKLLLDQVIEPADPVPPGGTTQQGNPADSAHVKHIKIQSDLLTAFWGTPMYIGANILLPEGYDNSMTNYPVVYSHGHYPFSNPFGFTEDLSNSFSAWWVAAGTPRMIAVTIRHENPYYDDSYAVNSANLGPYGDAITQELIPAIDAAFRTIPERWARTLTGGSTGGWEALAQMAFYPEMYQGAWAFAPDSVDFRFHQLINVYEDENAYFTQSDWVDVPRPASRDISGDVRLTMEQENHFELALGTHGRSGWGQWDIWQAVYGPQGPDGYPAPIWDKVTGQIDKTVAEAWRPMDLRSYFEENWATVGRKVTGRIHVGVGDDDNYFLNNAVELLDESLAARTYPLANAEFWYGPNGGHSWRPYTTPELLTIMYDAMCP